MAGPQLVRTVPQLCHLDFTHFILGKYKPAPPPHGIATSRTTAEDADAAVGQYYATAPNTVTLALLIEDAKQLNTKDPFYFFPEQPLSSNRADTHTTTS